MQAWEKHEERSEKVADQLRATLVTLAIGGVGAAYAVSDRVVHRSYWIIAAGAFVLCLACIIRSWFVAKHRALKRRDAARAKKAMPRFAPWGRKSSWFWDSLGACALIAGAAVLAIGFWLRQ
jgi:hypothetical protein